MAARLAGSRVRGALRVRNILRSLPDECQQMLVQELEAAGPKVLQRARSEAPRRTGALKEGLGFKVYPRLGQLIVGIYGSKQKVRDLFYGRILEFGRRAQTVMRRSRSGVRHPMKVKPIPASRYDIIGPRTLRYAQYLLRPALKNAFSNALRRAGEKAGNE